MKKILFLLLIVFLSISCKQSVSENPSFSTSNEDLRFVVIYQQSDFSSGSQIILDKVTGKHYFFYKVGYSGGLVELND